MARIDHVAEAREWIDEAPRELFDAGLNAGTPERANLCAQLAQAHAVLALAEQTRLANLISLASCEGDNEALDGLRAEAGDALVAWVHHSPDDEHPETRPDIAAALGIGGGDGE